MAQPIGPGRPAVPCVLAFAFGAACADAARAVPVGCLLAGLALLLAALLSRRRRPAARAFVLLALAAFGAARGAAVRVRADTGVEGWLPRDGTAVELDLLAVIVRAPERETDGSFSLLASARPPGAPWRRPIAVRLRVEGSDPRALEEVSWLRRGDAVRLWCRLRTPARIERDGREDPVRALLAQGLDATGSVKSARLVRRLGKGRPGVARLLDRLRVRALARLDLALGDAGRARAVLGAMLLGERSRLVPEDVRLLREGGLLHLLAISGLHVSLAALLLSGVLRRSAAPPWALFALAGPAIAAFAFAVGAAPPVVRAGLGASLALWGRAMGRDGDALNTLAVAAGGMVALSPGLLWNAGFQLTVLATAGLIGLSGRAASALPLPQGLSRVLALSAAAYAATAPVLAWRFERLTPVALASNLLAGPLSALVLGTGAAALVLAGVPGLGEIAAWAARSSVEALLALAGLAECCPFGSFRVARPPAFLVAAYVALLLLAAARSAPGACSRRRAVLRLARLGFVLAAILLHLGPWPTGEGKEPEVSILDVGQGLAVAVRGPAGNCLLVDAGGTARGRFDAGERIVTPRLLRWGCRRVDTLILTHDHDDHAGGAAAVLRDLEVGEIWIGAGSHRDRATRATIELAARRGTAVVLAERGLRRRRGGAEVEVLHPGRSDAELPVNDRCVVVRLSWDPLSVLVPGDLEAEGEGRLLARGENLAASVLVVGHHGAAASTSASWIARVGPRLAVVSVGRENRFGHPHPEVLARLARAGCQVFRTDRDGAVVLRPGSGGSWEAETEIRGKRWEGE